MRFLKKENLARKNIENDSLAVDINGQVIMDTTNVLLIPKGSDAQRPASPVNGHVRYNTDGNEFEVYQNGAWRNVRFKEAATITQQTLGNGDDVETTFGPLNPVPAAAQNVIILIENVIQISTTNYTLVQNPSSGPNAPYASGWYIVFSDAVPTGKPVTALHGFDL